MELQRTTSLQNSISASSLSELAMFVCAQAKEQEEAGEFEAAREILSEHWQRVGERPLLKGLELNARAEVLLRVGSLSGWIGSSKQVSGAQEIAKDLITEAVGIFEQLRLTEKVAEARIDLAICYWREGAYDEARVILQQIVDLPVHQSGEQRLRALVNSALIERSSMRYHEALRIHTESAALFNESRNHALRGKFHNEFATVLKNIGFAERREDYTDRALVEYAAASFHFEEAGHKRFLGVVENNLGFLFVYLGKFDDAHEHLTRARSVAVSLKDRGLVAQFDDTRARAFLAQHQYNQAERIAQMSVRALQEGDHQSILAEALTTHGTALARLGRTKDALSVLERSLNLAEQIGDRESGGMTALTIVEELGSFVQPTSLRQYYLKAEANLALSQHAGVQLRLGECARKILAAEDFQYERSVETKVQVTNDMGSGRTSFGQLPATPKLSSGPLEEEVRRYEAQLIKQALDEHGGSVTRAARSLGITHQGLAFILNGRHKDLLSARTPIKPRRRSIIRF
jgi:tetratricopeptide (TPR) repeat protein